MMGHSIAPLILGAIGGYWVLERSVKQKSFVRIVGQFVGLALIVVSFAGMACKIACVSGGAMCDLRGGNGKKMCPYSARKAPGGMHHPEAAPVAPTESTISE